ncbi:hypothetical protein GJM98_16150 [Vibrio parahaemolyticus]|nr:hypothetical protein [Vibrio parahaemolyticus]EGR3006892.1 hypothetical protein [Vibrio parahaemolyticus]EGR3142566.1 hypothetical protein [Vibrio parahaemolyticus]EGR3183382.1 hypothetical protein [Vibrio parahaemolyticus]EGR3198162.1 hypothetical protein [Vibrio parahaemolyticus]
MSGYQSNFCFMHMQKIYEKSLGYISSAVMHIVIEFSLTG